MSVETQYGVRLANGHTIVCRTQKQAEKLRKKIIKTPTGGNSEVVKRKVTNWRGVDE